MPGKGSFQDWLARIAAGDNEAVTELFNLYSRRLIGLARKRLDEAIRRFEGPSDVVQSVLESFVFRHASGEYDLTDEASLWRLLAAMTVNKCVSRRRKYLGSQKRNIAREMSGAVDDEALGIISREPSPEAAAILVEKLHQLMESLPLNDRTVVTLLLQGLSPNKIKTQAGISLATVYRVRKRVRERLEREDRDAD